IASSISNLNDRSKSLSWFLIVGPLKSYILLEMQAVNALPSKPILSQYNIHQLLSVKTESLS
ncbi:hypothetical protein, partial [Corallococcus exercitus]|uniref:hypothetical protein n=1 Tax=Corallococcus exercitus TaxID=2316736 RepID=UPI001C108004